MTIIVFLLVLAVLIFVHELGHFLAARACGIRVDAFKIGFGPKILAWKKGETEYGVNWIPFGGYVKIHGEDPNAENTTGPDAARSFVNKPRWQQVIVLVAGVTFNFIFAWFLYIGVFATGVTASPEGFERYADRFENERIMIAQVLPDSPAAGAGLKEGDVIKALTVEKNAGVVSGEALIKTQRYDDPESVELVQSAIGGSDGRSVSLEYERAGVLDTALIQPESGIVEGAYAIGISMSEVVDMKLSFFSSIGEGLRYTLILIRETFIGLYHFLANIFIGQPNFTDITGPIGIAGIVGNAATLGIAYLIMITAIISINLGVVNLIPFPALDGGRVLFVLIEGVIRRRIPAGFTNSVNMVGFILLMLLMVAVTFKDVARLVG